MREARLLAETMHAEATEGSTRDDAAALMRGGVTIGAADTRRDGAAAGVR